MAEEGVVVVRVVEVEVVDVEDLDDGFELGASLFSVVKVVLVLVLRVD